MKLGAPVDLMLLKQFDDIEHLDAYQTCIGAEMYDTEVTLQEITMKALEFGVMPQDKIIVNHLPVWYNFCNVTRTGFTTLHCGWQAKYSSMLGMQYMVAHPGFKQKNGGDAMVNIIESLTKLLPILEETNVTLLLENCAGNGLDSQFGKVDEILTIMDIIQDPHIGMCFDTCHGWAYGEDMVTESFWKNKASRAEVIHFNMPKFLERGSKKDRHAPSAREYYTLYPEQYVNPVIKDKVLILENASEMMVTIEDIKSIKERINGNQVGEKGETAVQV